MNVERRINEQTKNQFEILFYFSHNFSSFSLGFRCRSLFTSRSIARSTSTGNNKIHAQIIKRKFNCERKKKKKTNERRVRIKYSGKIREIKKKQQMMCAQVEKSNRKKVVVECDEISRTKNEKRRRKISTFKQTLNLFLLLVKIVRCFRLGCTVSFALFHATMRNE